MFGHVLKLLAVGAVNLYYVGGHLVELVVQPVFKVLSLFAPSKIAFANRTICS